MIKLKEMRIKNFRGIKNLLLDLDDLTILTGMNNVGKTSILKALQIVFGNKYFITKEDFYIQNDKYSDKIIIDALITPLTKKIRDLNIGGATKYKTFIKLAELLKILFFIFSDNDRPNEDDIKKKVENQVKNYSSKIPNDVIIFLNSGNNFEEELLKIDGYEDIIKQAILNSIEYKNEQHKQAKYEKIFNKSKKEILEDMKKNKTKYAFYIAKEIEKNDIKLPQKVVELFEKIKQIIG